MLGFRHFLSKYGSDSYLTKYGSDSYLIKYGSDSNLTKYGFDSYLIKYGSDSYLLVLVRWSPGNPLGSCRWCPRFLVVASFFSSSMSRHFYSFRGPPVSGSNLTKYGFDSYLIKYGSDSYLTKYGSDSYLIKYGSDSYLTKYGFDKMFFIPPTSIHNLLSFFFRGRKTKS